MRQSTTLPFPASRTLLAIVASTALAAVALAVRAAGQPPDAVVGTWLTEAGEQGGKAKVEITVEDDSFTGRIVWLEEPLFESGEHEGEEKRDLENPDRALRERPILGLPILEGFSYEGDGTWSGGTIYDPANGKTYKAKMYLDGTSDDTLEIRGYIGIPLLGRTTTWRRVAD